MSDGTTMMESVSWAGDAVFYHIYPLGLCGAPLANDFTSAPVYRLAGLQEWVPYIKSLGCNALYLGPVFESDFHGYDTADYFRVDRRLGDNNTLRELSTTLRQHDIKLVLDTVFNHTGRNFWAFRDLQLHGEGSAYKDWFAGVDFSRQSPYGDNFAYEGWYDAYNLVRLNLSNPKVKEHLFAAVKFWMEEFCISGLRLDVAEIMDKQFLAELAAFCHAQRSDFWLMGEVINGDYNQWANPHMLDSTTNYEAYKGIYSSHNDKNYYEIAYTLNRQFGTEGIYKNLRLYNFADNHDTTRIASILHNPAHLLLVYTLLFAMPGIPAIYYGSEWGQQGIKGEHEDTALRPALTLTAEHASSAMGHYVRQLAALRHQSSALKQGTYRELYVTHQLFVFARYTADEVAVIALNSSDQLLSQTVAFGQNEGLTLHDALDAEYATRIHEQEIQIQYIPPDGARVLIGREA